MVLLHAPAICNWTGIRFVETHLGRGDVTGKTVLEVGALDVNGTVRPTLEALQPESYIGLDISPGPSVDEVCDVTNLVRRFGEESFDLVVSTEMIEHVRDWRRAFDQMKRVLRGNGLLVVTTRSPGFKVHGYPYDFWRYRPDDMREILADFDELVMEEDEIAPGVFVRGRKPIGWQPNDLAQIALHSVITGGKTLDVTTRQITAFKAKYFAHQFYRAALRGLERAHINAH